MTPNRPLPRLANYWGKASGIAPIGTQYMRGLRYQVCGIDADICIFLHDLAVYLRQAEFRPGRLLPLRADFRQITGRNFLPLGLVFSLNRKDYLERRLAVWLLGRCTWPRGVAYLRNCPHSTPFELQFEIARAMRRLRAWSELRQLELQVMNYPECEPSFSDATREETNRCLERLKRMCQQHAAADHAIRLANFLSSGVAAAHRSDATEHNRQTLWYQEPLGPGKQPKSRWFIRKILERIRVAVRGT